MTLEDRDILQMDATIIAGALVLLTVSSFATGSLLTQSILISITTVLVINFGASAISILWKNKRDHFVLWALGTLIFVMVILMIINVSSAISAILSPPSKEDSKELLTNNQSNRSGNDEVNITRPIPLVSE
jgi:hypothetical protein